MDEWPRFDPPRYVVSSHRDHAVLELGELLYLRNILRRSMHSVLVSVTAIHQVACIISGLAYTLDACPGDLKRETLFANGVLQSSLRP